MQTNSKHDLTGIVLNRNSLAQKIKPFLIGAVNPQHFLELLWFVELRRPFVFHQVQAETAVYEVLVFGADVVVDDNR